MTKEKVIEITEKYNMEPLYNNVIEQMTVGFYMITTELIPELDEAIEKQDIWHYKENEAYVNRLRLDPYEYHYEIYVPEGWINRYGWI